MTTPSSSEKQVIGIPSKNPVSRRRSTLDDLPIFTDSFTASFDFSSELAWVSMVEHVNFWVHLLWSLKYLSLGDRRGVFLALFFDIAPVVFRENDRGFFLSRDDLRRPFIQLVAIYSVPIFFSFFLRKKTNQEVVR